MKPPTATLILWVRSWGNSDGELIVSGAQEANALDLVERSHRVAEISRVIVVTDSPRLADVLRNSPVVLDVDSDLASTPFGKKLRSIIDKYAIETLVYLGGGSGVFMEVDDMARLTRAALSFPETLWVNNFYSTDFAAFGTTLNLSGLSRCHRDNRLGWTLGRETGNRVGVLPSGLMTRFDIDTPVDLTILKTCQKKLGYHLEEFLSGVALDSPPVPEVMDVIVQREKRTLVIGRVPLETAEFFDRETACHVNFHIEGRGMESREESKENHSFSLIGQSLEKMGVPEFFQTLSKTAQAVILDSRLCFGHFGLSPSSKDRFFSDLLCPDRIDDPFVQCFTRHALQSPVPVILGGHTLVSGGLYVLAESAWCRTEEPLHRGLEDISKDSWGGAHFGTRG